MRDLHHIVRHVLKPGMCDFAVLAFVLSFGGALGAGEIPRASLTARDVVERMEARDRVRTSKLHSYTSLRHYELENKRFGTRASMTVRATYWFPGYKHFEIVSESGSPSIRNKVFRKMLDSELEASKDDLRASVQITSRNYNFDLLKTTDLDGRPSFLLEAKPKSKNPLLFHGRVWVDAEDYAIARIEGSPAHNVSFWCRKTLFTHQYRKVGEFWLASSNVSDNDVLVFGRSQVRIDYDHYQITAEQPNTLTESRPKMPLQLTETHSN